MSTSSISARMSDGTDVRFTFTCDLTKVPVEDRDDLWAAVAAIQQTMNDLDWKCAVRRRARETGEQMESLAAQLGLSDAATAEVKP